MGTNFMNEIAHKLQAELTPFFMQNPRPGEEPPMPVPGRDPEPAEDPDRELPGPAPIPPSDPDEDVGPIVPVPPVR
jgi:hypothetical protein